MIAIVKSLHIAALVIWCAGLLTLPILLRVYGRRREIRTQAGFSEFRLLVHAAYTRIVTPAAIIAIAAGTVLILILSLHPPWMLAKLGLVALMVLLHGWLGHLIVRTAEGKGRVRTPDPILALPAALLLISGILVIVLAKPDFAPLIESLPEIFRTPLGRQLPSRLVPI